MIYGNKIGGNSADDKTYLIENNGIEVWGVVVDDADMPEPTARCEDVIAGRVFIGADGLQVGTNDCPCCRVTKGIHEVAPGVEFVLCLKKYSQWDYTALQGVITQKNTPYKVENLIIGESVYDKNGEKISDVTKDPTTCSIRFNIKNETVEPQLLHFFICKEEYV